MLSPAGGHNLAVKPQGPVMPHPVYHRTATRKAEKNGKNQHQMVSAVREAKKKLPKNGSLRARPLI